MVAFPNESRTNEAAGMEVESLAPRFPGGGAARSIRDLTRRRPVSDLPDPVSPLSPQTHHQLPFALQRLSSTHLNRIVWSCPVLRM